MVHTIQKQKCYMYKRNKKKKIYIYVYIYILNHIHTGKWERIFIYHDISFYIHDSQLKANCQCVVFIKSKEMTEKENKRDVYKYIKLYMKNQLNNDMCLNHLHTGAFVFNFLSFFSLGLSRPLCVSFTLFALYAYENIWHKMGFNVWQMYT